MEVTIMGLSRWGKEMYDQIWEIGINRPVVPKFGDREYPQGWWGRFLYKESESAFPEEIRKEAYFIIDGQFCGRIKKEEIEVKFLGPYRDEEGEVIQYDTGHLYNTQGEYIGESS
jgi:hypothetical protein